MLQYHPMTSAQIIAQVLGFVGLGCNITSVQCKRRRWVLTFQALADIVYGAQYIFLSAWSGLAISLVSAVECGVIYYFATRPDTGHGKRGADGNLRMPLPVLLITMAVVGGAGVLSYSNPISALPTVITLVYTWMIWQPNLRVYRVVSALISVGWFTYNLCVGAYVPTITAVVEFISAISAIVRIDVMMVAANKKDGAQSE